MIRHDVTLVTENYFWGFPLFHHRTQPEASVILGGTAPPVLTDDSVSIGGFVRPYHLTRVQLTPSSNIYSSARDSGVPASQVSLRTEATV